ncbi:MAG: UDP-2,3-diacylglucosamine hydrolase [Betaproteobacteria bacterium]|nr:UDP-2,3-diacylglucosamine hydrolase [Betaproteobacteria bacterium]
MTLPDPPAPARARSLFLSDIHLGTRACRAGELLTLLRDYDCENIFLVGDIIDFWAMSRGIYWSQLQNTVVQKILKKARHGTRVYLIPGNHDEALRDYVGTAFGDINLVRDYVHKAADGRRYLLVHGDEYDQVTTYHRWVSILGDIAYHWLVHVNRLLSLMRRKLGISGHWSLADYAKRNMLHAVSFISNFEESVVHTAKKHALDGVICGHIHTPVIKQIDGLVYINCGDWVDSCTAVVEHLDGRMELVRSMHPTGADALHTAAA